jgi:exodeoxyribonuclease VII small subunit
MPVHLVAAGFPFLLDSPTPLTYFAAMSKAVQDLGKPAESGLNLPFEEALKRLESIVHTMETDELPLETLLSRYEEGTKMIQICQSKLSEAEVKIQQLEKTANGQFTLKPLALSSEQE